MNKICGCFLIFVLLSASSQSTGVIESSEGGLFFVADKGYGSWAQKGGLVYLSLTMLGAQSKPPTNDGKIVRLLVRFKESESQPRDVEGMLTVMGHHFCEYSGSIEATLEPLRLHGYQYADGLFRVKVAPCWNRVGTLNLPPLTLNVRISRLPLSENPAMPAEFAEAIREYPDIYSHIRTWEEDMR